jgi:tetratricopeptide (TPR) repeat protein
MSRLLLLLYVATAACAQTPDSLRGLIEDGHFKRARAAAEARYKESPNDPEVVWALSRVRQIWGSLDEAQKLAEKAVALAPKEARYHFQLAEVVGQKAEKAGMISQIGLGRQFKKEADLTVQLDPRHTGALRDLMMFYLEAPAVIGGDKAKARSIAAEIARVDPVEGAVAEIDLARREKREVPAGELLRKAVEARPQSYSGRINLGSHLANRKKFDEAAQHAREAIRLNPGRVGGYSLLAAILVHQDKWSDLDALLGQAGEAVPDNLQPYFRAANNCLARKVELARAERYLQKYLSAGPEPGSPNEAVTRWRLALVLEQLGRKPEAVIELQTSLRIEPKNDQAKSDLKRLKG